MNSHFLGIAGSLAAAALLAGCLTQNESPSSERPLATAAAVTSGIGPVQKYIYVAWGDNKNSNLQISKLAWGWQGRPSVVATGNVDGTQRTNGLFYLQTNGIWTTIANTSMTDAKTSFAVDPPTQTTGRSAWFAAKGDGWIYKANGTSEVKQYSPYKEVAVGNDVAAGNNADMWMINQADNLVYHRSNGTVFPTSMKAKKIAVGGKGVPWAINMSDQACYLPKMTSVWKCPAGPKASAIAAGTDANASAWMLGTVPIAPYKDFPIYRFDGTEWLRCNGAATQIAVANDGNPWILNAFGQVFSGVPEPRQDEVGSIGFGQSIGIVAREIAIGGPNNTTMAMSWAEAGNGTYNLMNYNAIQSTWTQTKGTGFNVDIGYSGKAWLIGGDKRIWQSSNFTNWSPVGGGSFQDVGAGLSGYIWAVGNDAFDNQGNFALYRWADGYWERNNWLGAVRVDVAPDGHPWVVTKAGDIFESADAIGQGFWFLRFGPRATDIGIGGSSANRAVWITSDKPVDGGSDFSIYKYSGDFAANDKWKLYPGGAIRISVRNDGKPWIRNSSWQIWKGQ